MEEADQETAARMLEAANIPPTKTFLDEKDINNISSVDLRTVDQLWVHYSNGRFGFSVQKKIYFGLGGTERFDKKVWEEFGAVVGWRKGGELLGYSQITFDLQNNTSIPQPQYGHLPCIEYKKIEDKKKESVFIGGAIVKMVPYLSRIDF